ncbi:MAG: manganese efflux pump [Rikenellaceae bacterium]
MDFALLLIVALSLSADSFTVSLGLGASQCRVGGRGVVLALMVGVMHALFVVCGVLLSKGVVEYIAEYSGWIGFGVLVFLGVRMIVERIRDKQNNPEQLNYINSLYIAVAVSLDAFAVGGVLELIGLGVDLWVEAFVFLIITMFSVIVGLVVGSRVGRRYSSWAQVTGGVLLILLGIKFLL